ncbi:MAG: MFS transporter, partial [Erythrobacter sp.]|nr:MFS transporter [Erythrobacter sp.]
MQESGTPSKQGVFARFLQVREGELGRVLLSGGCFFLLLFGYFLLRPIREAMGVQRSMRDLQWLFLVTCGVSLIVTLAFGGVVARFDRKRFITIAYRVVIVCLLGFIAAQQLLSGDQLVLSGYVFYVWLSVVNLFIISVFWALMADVWSLKQGKRLFATIGIGGTLGAFLGSNFVWWLA